MTRIRRAEEAIVARYPEQEIRCPTHLSIGQEAVAVGVCQALSERDVMLSGHRCHAHYLAKGGSLRRLFAELYGKATGCCGGKGGSMHLASPETGMLGASAIVAGTVPIAVGAALRATGRPASRRRPIAGGSTWARTSTSSWATGRKRSSTPGWLETPFSGMPGFSRRPGSSRPPSALPWTERSRPRWPTPCGSRRRAPSRSPRRSTRTSTESGRRMRELKYREAIDEATRQAMAKDERVFVLGVGVDDAKGI